MATDATLLTNVTNAINAILLGGQSITLGDRVMSRANLKELRELRSELEARIRRATPGASNVNHVSFGDAEGPSISGRRLS
jgi:hypothetical protein